MEPIIESLKTLDFTQLVAISAIFWVFYKRIDRKFEAIDKKFDKVFQEIHEIKSEITQLDKRIFAIETMLRMKECCMIKDSSQLKKAE